MGVLASWLLPLAVLPALLVLTPSLAGARGVCPPGEPEPAEVSFVGVTLDGPVDPTTSQLVSPARFAVEQWVSGTERPDEVDVETAVESAGQFFRYSNVGITPKAGERWRIHGDREQDGVITTSVCHGSELVRVGVRIPEPEVEPEPGPGPREPGDDRALSLGVAAAAATAIAVVLSRGWA